MGGTKLSRKLRARLQTVDTAHVELGEAEPIEVTTNYVSVFNTVLPETMAQYQRAVHRPMWGWHCQSLGKVCWGSLVAFHFPTGPARADHDWIAQLG